MPPRRRAKGDNGDDDVAAIVRLLPSRYAERLEDIHELARLWAGYGHIYRLSLRPNAEDDNDVASLILKYISAPSSSKTQDESSLRKLCSYRVEANFYEGYSADFNTRHGPRFSTPEFLGRPSSAGLLLSDLAVSHPHFAESARGQLTLDQSLAALDWFAAFHAWGWGRGNNGDGDGDWCPTTRQMMKSRRVWEGRGLWRVGTYNHLETRLDELAAISPSSPFAALGGQLAFAVEFSLLNPRDGLGQTLVHGDAKAANMAMRDEGQQSNEDDDEDNVQAYPPSWLAASRRWSIAMYDFQYVGVGVPTQDLIKFLATAVGARDLRNQDDEARLLRFYHDRLHAHGVRDYSWETFIHHWRLSMLSWVRFTQGWGRWGNTRWLEARAQEVMYDREWVEQVMRAWEERGARWGQDMLDEVRGRAGG